MLKFWHQWIFHSSFRFHEIARMNLKSFFVCFSDICACFFLKWHNKCCRFDTSGSLTNNRSSIQLPKLQTLSKLALTSPCLFPPPFEDKTIWFDFTLKTLQMQNITIISFSSEWTTHPHLFYSSTLYTDRYEKVKTRVLIQIKSYFLFILQTLIILN